MFYRNTLQIMGIVNKYLDKKSQKWGPLDISVIVPLFNEADNIEILYQELQSVLNDKIRLTYEIIFINDGNTDASLKVLEKIQAEDNQVIVIDFRRNFGQTAAMSAGFDYASGNVLITLDADLQNDPNDIPQMLQKLNEGFDMVCGWRYNRQDRFISRRLPSIIANKVISYTTNIKLHDYGCTLKVFRKELVDLIHLYGEMHRFIPAIVSGKGAKIAEVKVNHRSRKYGDSKYGITRTPRVILDLLTVKFLLDYSTRPIQVFGLWGFICWLFGTSIFTWLVIQRQFFDVPLANRPMFLLSILLIFIGLQFVTMGLLGELQVRTYHETQEKPIYTVRKIISSRDDS